MTENHAMRTSLSYVQLIRLPNVLALLSATCLSRLADRMFVVVIVFHALAAFGSPGLAGWLSFAAIAPGFAVSPLAGAFLDRSGAARGIVVDLTVSTALVLALAVAVGVNLASPPVLLGLVTVYALTTPLSAAGVRVLLPRLVPAGALDRANALDNAMFAIADVAGPPLAGAIIGMAGAVPAFVAIAVVYAAATLCLARVRGGREPSPSPRGFLREAKDSLIHVVRVPLLRGLAVGYGLYMVTWGILIVAVPVIVAQRFAAGTWEPVAGLLWAGLGVASGIGALGAGQSRILGRETKVMTRCMIATAVAVWPIAALSGMPGLIMGLMLAGLLAGPIDVGLLTLRQRRTEPAQLGRVLAVSMSMNQLGLPVGTAIGGVLAAWSPGAALFAAAAASLLAALATFGLIPAED
jgi:MFS family permease